MLESDIIPRIFTFHVDVSASSLGGTVDYSFSPNLNAGSYYKNILLRALLALSIKTSRKSSPFHALCWNLSRENFFEMQEISYNRK